MKKQIRNWERNKSKMGLVLALAIMLSAFLGNAIGGGNTVQETGTLVIATACVYTTNTASINFGSFNPSLNTAGTINAIAVTNAGNSNSNVLVSGSNWNSGGNQFDVHNTIWQASSQSYFAPNSPYSSANAANFNQIRLDGTSRDTFIPVNTVSANFIYYGAAIPSVTQAAGTYTQTLNVISSC